MEQGAVCKRNAQPLKTETYEHHVVWTRGGGGSYLIVSGPYLVEQRAVCKRNAQPLKAGPMSTMSSGLGGGGRYLIVSGPYLVEQRAVCKRYAQPLKDRDL